MGKYCEEDLGGHVQEGEWLLGLVSRRESSVLCRGNTTHTCIHVQYRSDARYNERALRTRLHVQGNAFARSSERVCAFKETRLHVQANVFARSRKRVCAFKRTRLSCRGNVLGGQANAFARCNKRT